MRGMPSPGRPPEHREKLRSIQVFMPEDLYFWVRVEATRRDFHDPLHLKYVA